MPKVKSSRTQQTMKYRRKILDKNFFYIPERYHRVMFESGLIDSMVKIIHKVNREEKRNPKKLFIIIKCPTNKRADISTQTTSDDYVIYNEDYKPCLTYTSQ
ncbi:unnamed protein product [Rotaria magnacalcarata]|uniref:Uncharacterized protein n=1 Tax=Rotaria magnacalcarata TaxID=392030 RepID=A0A816Q834_9BILA|nr:unnamed protein product [Rotaria magnacalcarata]CAF3948248.1 unnamed protein product [Rotaria magnacalcarata]